MTDFELIVKEFCIPMESEFICDELCGWYIDKEDESWCSRNCGKTNCGKYPEMNCYKEWVKMKRSDGEMTNADKIRNMSNWELAEFIYNVSNGATKISTCEEKCA